MRRIIVKHGKLGLYAMDIRDGTVGLTDKKHCTIYPTKRRAKVAIKKLALTGLRFIDLDKNKGE